MRENLYSLDSIRFFNKPKLFVEYIQPILAGGRNVLLTYDRYRAPIKLAILVSSLLYASIDANCIN